VASPPADQAPGRTVLRRVLRWVRGLGGVFTAGPRASTTPAVGDLRLRPPWQLVVRRWLLGSVRPSGPRARRTPEARVRDRIASFTAFAAPPPALTLAARPLTVARRPLTVARRRSVAPPPERSVAPRVPDAITPGSFVIRPSAVGQSDAVRPQAGSGVWHPAVRGTPASPAPALGSNRRATPTRRGALATPALHNMARRLLSAAAAPTLGRRGTARQPSAVVAGPFGGLTSAADPRVSPGHAAGLGIGDPAGTATPSAPPRAAFIGLVARTVRRTRDVVRMGRTVIAPSKVAWRAGPDVSDPVGVGSRPVGGDTLPAGAPPMPHVELSARPHGPVKATVLGSPGPSPRPRAGSAVEPAGTGADPVVAWRSAVRARSLEHPRSLPTRLVPLARSLGVTGVPRFTTGPRTTTALRAARALGATTGDVVHIERLPGGDGSGNDKAAAVLRHELSHAARPAAGPRFLRPGHRGSSPDELLAVRSERPLATAPTVGPTLAPGVVSQLPIAGPSASPAPAVVVQGSGEPTTPSLDTISFRQEAPPSSGSAGTAGSTTGTGTGAEPAPPASGASGGSAGGPSGSPGAAAHPEPDLDRILEALGDRMLREIERRGGRWAATF
jgi:hypothetical protein